MTALMGCQSRAIVRAAASSRRWRAVVNDNPEDWQSRELTEPQREAAERSEAEGLSIINTLTSPAPVFFCLGSRRPTWIYPYFCNQKYQKFRGSDSPDPKRAGDTPAPPCCLVFLSSLSVPLTGHSYATLRAALQDSIVRTYGIEDAASFKRCPASPLLREGD